jgi:hypothetical protein
MNVTQLFDKLRVISNVEIVVSLLPASNIATQAKSGLEWATRRLSNQSYIIAPTIYEIFKGDGSTFVGQ